MKKLMAIAVALVFLLAMVVTTPVAANSDINVYPGDSIQAAVDAASPGDTIIVHAGEYHQSVAISTSDIALKGEQGAILGGTPLPMPPPIPPADTDTILAWYGISLEPGVSGVTIEGFEIRNYSYGILLNGADNNSVKKNKIVDSTLAGIGLDGADGNEVLKNEATGITHGQGIRIMRSTGNLIKRNKVANSGGGILLGITNDNQVIQNEVIGATLYGISSRESMGSNLIMKNKVSDSGAGIALGRANAHQVIQNEVTGSTREGIVLSESTGNLIKQNKLADNGSGILLGYANDNQVIANKVTGSTYQGISAEVSTGNLIKKNKVIDSGSLDLYDSSAPPPLDNTWVDNKYETANFRAD